MDSLLPEDQKISLLDQLLHRYQGLSRQIKTEATEKPTVVTNVASFTYAIEVWGGAFYNKYLSRIDKFLNRAFKLGYTKVCYSVFI